MSETAVRYLDLGPMAIERGGVVVPVTAQRVSSALACLLVRVNNTVSPDALIDAVWSGHPPDGAEATLDSHLWRLRQLLEPDRRRGEPFATVVRDTAGYRLAATADQVDSLLFERLAGDARDLLLSQQPQRALARCDEALTLWRGDPWAPHTDQLWATAAAARLQQLNTQIVRQRLQAMLQLGNADTVLNDVEPLIAAEPLDEGLWELSMLAAYRLGRVGQALDTYTRARRALIEEAGIEPGPQLRDLQSRILSRDTSLNGPSRPAVPLVGPEPEVHIPVRRTELIGRDTETTQLLAAVVDHQLVTLVGPAGCGKTRLVIEVARRAAPAFPDGVWFVDLTAANDKGQLLDAITSALGLAAPEVGTITEGLRAFTRTRRMLLVLDNCEHLLDDVAELVDTLLDRRSETALLTTSREPLAVDGEHVHTLTPLALPTPQQDLSGEALAHAPAVQLFLQRLHTAAPHTTARTNASASDDDDSNSQVRLAAKICEALDGLPLAIELAAGQARTYTLQEILTHVRTDSASLARTGRGGARHHATLSGAIKLSVDTLTRDELTLHQALAVVPGPFTTELAAHLADSAVADTAARLANLVHRSMLSPLPPLRPSGPTRFSQLVTIRSHSQTTLAPEERRRLEQRRDDWVVNLTTNMPPFGHADEIAWFTRVDDDLSAVRATLQSCLIERPNETGAFVATRLNTYWFFRGMITEWERWSGLAATSTVSRPFDRLVAGCCHAGAASLSTRGSLSREWIDELAAYPYPLSATDKAWLVPYMLTLVLACLQTGNLEEGRHVAALMREFADESGNPAADLIAQVARVMSTSPTEDPSITLQNVDNVYRQAQAAGNHFAIWVIATAGAIASVIGRVADVGLHWSDVVLDTFRQIGADPPVARLEARGVLLLASDQPFEAVRSIARSRSLARRIGGTWPSPGTEETLRAAQSRLTAAEAERAYQEGLLDRGQQTSPTAGTE